MYYALVPGKDQDNQFGPRREATALDKVLGIVGMIAIVGISVGALMISA